MGFSANRVVEIPEFLKEIRDQVTRKEQENKKSPRCLKRGLFSSETL